MRRHDCVLARRIVIALFAVVAAQLRCGDRGEWPVMLLTVGARQFAKNIGLLLDQFGSLLDQSVRPTRQRRMNRARDGEYLAPHVGREARCDERPAALRCFDDQYAARQACNDTVAAGKVG